MQQAKTSKLVLDRELKSGPYFYDPDEALQWVNFFPTFLQHVTGKWNGDRFILDDWQRQIVEDIFGWRRYSDGTRRFRMANIFVARKNGKSELAAGFGLAGLTFDNEARAEVYSVAGDRGQAAIIFNTARDMAIASDKFSKLMIYQHHLLHTPSSSVYKVLSSESGTKFGFNPHFTLFDELFVQKDKRLYEALTTAGGTRSQPLHVNISTSGFDQNTLCGEVWKHSVDVLNGVVEDDELYPVVYSVPSEADWTDENIWRLANPALDSFLSIETLRTEFKRAKNNLDQQNTFRRYRLNQWTQQETRWMDLDAWDACKTENAEQMRENLRGAVCYGGLDLASRADMTALALVFPVGVNEFKSLMFYWCPATAIERRSRVDRVPYDAWVRSKHLRTTPGNTIDFDFIRKDINELAKEFKLRHLGIDDWNSAQIGTQLKGDGVSIVAMRQGYKTLSEPMKVVFSLVADRKLEHDGSPIMRWNVNNVAPEKDAADNIKPAKQLSREKIDGVSALVMAQGLAILNENKPSVYENRGVRSV